jgi:hypothetical protein
MFGFYDAKCPTELIQRHWRARGADRWHGHFIDSTGTLKSLGV